MSEPKLISPLLDGFTMGNPMSSHDGVQCCPALKEKSDNKYIVKIISVPASQVQLEALLLTGAYKDPADAMDYFKAVTDEIAEEAAVLSRLSKLEGFLPYDSWQIVPMEEGRLGYEVYLISSYKRSLERFIQRSALTHLDAVNLGLDLCQALTICRQAGYLYVDLKPGNVFISRDRDYRIGDLGFVALDSLAYTSLAEKYTSPYSAPEARDALKTLNDTVDTYAVGMILYQIYNGGALPAAPLEPGDPFPSPVNGDYEIAEIILKALAPDPKDRWESPMAMGKALVEYMKRNAVTKTPITPQGALNTEGVSLEETAKEAEEAAKATEAAEQSEAAPETAEEPAPETIQEPSDAVISEESSPEEPAEETVPPQMPELVPGEEEAPGSEEAPLPETISLPELVAMDSAGSLPKSDFQEILEPDEEDEKLFSLNKPSLQQTPQTQEQTTQPAFLPPRRKTPHIQRNWGKPLAVLLILGLIGFGSFWYYQNTYLQTIDDLTVEGSMNSLTVTVDTQIDPALLRVVCTDNYGNAYTKPLSGGKVVFTDLLPNSQYKIQLEIDGFHALVGKTTDMFNTEALTNVVSFTAGIGPEDGSAVLTMTVEGGEPEEWMLIYSTEDEDPQTLAFSGHSVTVKDLTIGKTYTFQLACQEDIPLNGITELEYTAARIAKAENLHVTSISEGSMTVRWNTAEDVVVDSWFVRCYDDQGSEQTQEVTSNAAAFSGIDPAKSYTIEVTAAGMTQPSRTTITANPITITGFQVDDNAEGLTVSWEFEGEAPEGSWLLRYGFNGSDKQSVVKCEEPTAVIQTKVPSAGYTFTIQAADSTSVLGAQQTYATGAPEIFFQQGLSAENITGHLLKTPEGEWSFESVGKEAFSDTFQAGDKLSLVLHSKIGFYLNDQEMSVLYVFRDEKDAVIQDLIAQDTINWKDLWFAGDYHYGELNIPTAPQEPGKYSLSLYFDNAAVIYITFTIQ